MASLRRRAGEVASWVREHPDPIFWGLLAVAFPIIVFGLGDYMWFFRDDWNLIAERELEVEDLLRHHNGHWITVPVLVFRVLYAIFGVRTYVPYLMSVVGVHLLVVAMLRTIMVRADVGPWVANAFAGALIFFGAGREDIIWAFQVGFTGSIAFVLVQLVLADHDGPIGRRDVLGLGFGFVGVMSASPAVVIVGVVGLSLLVRRGWRRALFHVVPLGIAYGAYAVLADPLTNSTGQLSADVVVDYLRNGFAAGFLGIGWYRPVVAGLVVVLVVGVAVHLFAPGGAASDTGLWARIRTIAVPIALFGGAAVFIILVARSRSFAGPEGVRARRYVYFYGVAFLPLLAVAAAALARRWRVLAMPLVALVLVAVPANVASFDEPPFGPAYHQSRRDVLTGVVAMPEARQVDGGLRPIPDPFMGEGVTLDFLLHAEATGKLPPPPDPMTAVLRNELLVRLSIEQLTGEPLFFCTPVAVPELRLRLEEGQSFGIQGQVAVRVVRDGRPLAPQVIYAPIDGNLLRGTGLDEELVITPVGGAAEVPLCVPADA